MFKTVIQAVLIFLFLVPMACERGKEPVESEFADIRLTSPGVPHPPKTETVEKLVQRCEEEPGRGCWLLGNLIADVDPDHAQKAYMKSCKVSYGIGCMKLFEISKWDFSDPEILKNEDAVAIVNNACDPEKPALTVSACEKLADLWKLKGDPKAGLLYRDLVRVSFEGYGKVGFAESVEKKGHKDLSCVLLRSACQDEVTEACRLAEKCKSPNEAEFLKAKKAQSGSPSTGMVLTLYSLVAEEFRTQGLLQRAIDIYETLCDVDRGLKGADFHTKISCKNKETLREAKKGFTEELPVLELACKEKGDRESCLKVASIYRNVGLSQAAVPFLAQWCKLDQEQASSRDVTACRSYQEALLESNSVKEYERVSLRLCELGMDDSCNRYLRYEYNHGDKDQAFKIAEQQCHSEESQFCNLRDIWLAKRGPEEAIEYYRLECEKENPRSCLYYGLALETSSQSEEAKKPFVKAGELFEKSCLSTKNKEHCLGVPLIKCIVGEEKEGEAAFKNACDKRIKEACKLVGKCSQVLEQLKGKYRRLDRWNT